MVEIDTIRDRAAGYLDDYLTDLEHLVNIDSGTYEKPGVDRAGAAFREMLKGIGCEAEIFPNSELGDNFVATLTGNGERRLMLVGHFDTVYPLGTTAERPFSIQNGRAYGPATCDMKGGLVLGLYAMRMLRDLGIDDFAEISFVANSDEEIGSPSSRELIEETCKRMDAVFVLEPGRSPGGVLATRKGVGMYELNVHGRASHAGASPREGRSATLEVAHKIIALNTLNDFEAGTTVSTNLLRGGTARNVIPAEAYAGIDVRVTSQAEAERVDSAIRAIADFATVPDTSSTLTGGLNRPPMEKSEGTIVLLDIARTIVDEMGNEYEELSSGGGSDGNFTAALGIPTLDGLGPVGRNAHSIDEYIETGSVADRLALVAGLLVRAPRRVGR